MKLPDRPPPSELSATAEERERTVQRLSAHFAADHLEISELERRLDLVYAATSQAELTELVADLPALSVDQEIEVASAPRIEPWRAVPRTQTMVAVMGGAERKGQWTPPRHMNVVAMMGGAKLDFREAMFGEPAAEVTIVVFMGGVEIVVPPGVRVESNGFALMGGFEQMAQDASAQDAPLVKVNGFACMGGVDIKVRLPGETEREARKRVKREKSRQRLQRGRDA
ncbi:MAG: DUF1707 domain-containing protein [Gemmatimonadales bacterium]